MTAVTTLTLTIGRASLPGGLSPLAFSGSNDSTLWGITGLQVPGRIRRNTTIPPADNVHGDELYATSLQQGLISFEARPTVTDEAGRQAALAELYAALDQAAYPTTITIGNAAPEEWDCQPGSAVLANSQGRTLVDLRDSKPVYIVTIPCFPIPAVGA